MKILVTGANGLLGQNLVYELFLRGFTVIATGKGDCRFDYSGSQTVRYYPLDIASPQDWKRLQELETGFDQVIHGAALTQVDYCEMNKEEAEAVNVGAVQLLIDQFAPSGTPIVYVSTDFVFNGEKGNYSEEDDTDPVNWYGQTKQKAENLIKQYTGPWSIARTCLVYGNVRYGNRSNIISWVKDNLEQGKPIKVVSDQWRTPTFVQDLAIGIALMVTQRVTGVFHISGDEMMSPYEMALRTAQHFGLNEGLIERVDASVFSQPGKRPPKTGFNITKAKQVLHFQPRSFSEGLMVMSQNNAGNSSPH